jgi:hypothetical protein
VINDYIVKIGGTRAGLRGRANSYLCGHHIKERSKSGDCSKTNGFIYNTFVHYLNKGFKIEMYAYKFQEGYKVFISTTDKYKVFIDNCGMTQSIVFILCKDQDQANKFLQILKHPIYVFLNNICRWGNFNNIRILQSFPIPITYSGNEQDLWDYYNITPQEILYICDNI